MAGKKDQCLVDDCDREARTSGLCNPCYQGLYYWRGRTPGDMVKRQRQLKVLENRMSMMTKVTLMPRAKKRA